MANNANLFEEAPDAEEVLNSFISTKKSCIPYVNPKTGQGYYVKISTPEARRANSAAVRNAVRAFTQLFSLETFLDAPDGIYTWIISDAGFLAARVLSLFEMGTLHKQLASFLGATKVFVAGECEKKGSAVELNLQSGTFTLKIIEKKDSNATVSDRLKAKARAAFETMGFERVTVLGDRTLIRDEKTPVTREELLLYKAAGFEVELYKKKEDCTQAALSALVGKYNNLVLRVKLKRKEVEVFEERTRAKNKSAKWLAAAPQELERAEEELAEVEEQLRTEQAKIAERRIPFEGGGRKRTTRKRRQ